MARITAGGTPAEPAAPAQDDQGGTAGGSVTSLDTKRQDKAEKKAKKQDEGHPSGPRRVGPALPVDGPSDHGSDVLVSPVLTEEMIASVTLSPDDWDELTPTVNAKKKHIYRASEMGSCIAALTAGALGTFVRAPFPDALKKGADEGTALETATIYKFCEEFHYRVATYPELVGLKNAGVIAGYDAQYQQIATATEIGKKALLITHPDAMVTHKLSEKAAKGKEPVFYDVEAKVFGPDNWKDWKKNGIAAFPRYAWQISARQRAHGLTMIMVIGRKEETPDGWIIAELDVKLFEPDTIPFDADVFDARIAEAEEHVRNEDVPACSMGTWPCTWFKEPFCMGDPEKEAKPDAVPLDDVLLGGLAGRLVAKRDDRKRIQTDHDTIVGDIDKHVAETGITRGQPYTVADVDGTLWLFEWVTQTRKAYSVNEGTNSFPTARPIGKVPPPTAKPAPVDDDEQPKKKKKDKKNKKKK